MSRLILNWHIGRVWETDLRPFLTPKQTPMETRGLVSRFHCWEPLPPSWILNSPPDWLKITAAILDLENNRVYCSRNNSLLSFSAPDWLPVIWAWYSSNRDKHRQLWANLGSKASLGFFFFVCLNIHLQKWSLSQTTSHQLVTTENGTTWDVRKGSVWYSLKDRGDSTKLFRNSNLP